MTDSMTSTEPPLRDNLSAMRADFISPFITSTVRVVSAMSGVQPVAQRPRLKQDLRQYADVTGLIGLLGEGVEGTLAISFEAPCILGIVSNMLGSEVSVLNHEIEDSVCELTNMISGAARADLESRGYSFRLAVPSVITRTGQKFATTLRSPVVQVPFQTDFGAFFVEAGLTHAPRGHWPVARRQSNCSMRRRSTVTSFARCDETISRMSSAFRGAYHTPSG